MANPNAPLISPFTIAGPNEATPILQLLNMVMPEDLENDEDYEGIFFFLLF